MEKIKRTIKRIKELDYQVMDKVQHRLDSLTKPQGSLGRLEELAKQVAGIRAKENPSMQSKVIFTLAGDHGIADEKVSAYPKEVTAQMVYNFLRGKAAINVLANYVGAKVVVVDMGVAEEIKEQKSLPRRQAGKFKNFKNKKINYGTKSFLRGPAMTTEEAVKSIEGGIDVFEEEFVKGIDIIGVGEMGIGNTTASSAITAVFTKKSVEDITDRGTGVNDEILRNKIAAIKEALKLNKPNPNDPIDVLSKVGGFEIGGLSGIILAAAARRIPVVIDGFISGAAALIAFGLEPKVKQYMIASHCSVERGHKIILDYIGIKPLFDLSLRLGEGTGAALGINLVEAGIKILTQMATFSDAGVSESSQ